RRAPPHLRRARRALARGAARSRSPAGRGLLRCRGRRPPRLFNLHGQTPPRRSGRCARARRARARGPAVAVGRCGVMSTRRLARHFEGKATEARVARVWSRLDARFDRAERLAPIRRAVLSLALALTFAALFWVAWRGSRAPAPLAPLHVLELA